MAGHSRLKDGVASARLSPAIHGFLVFGCKDVDARHKAGHPRLLETHRRAMAARDQEGRGSHTMY
jgi:hypothetical protein